MLMKGGEWGQISRIRKLQSYILLFGSPLVNIFYENYIHVHNVIYLTQENTNQILKLYFCMPEYCFLSSFYS